MTRKQQRIILALVAAVALTTAMACTFCCPTGTGPAVQAPTQPPVGVPATKAPEPTKAAAAPTMAPEPTQPAVEATPVSLGATQFKSFRFMIEMSQSNGDTTKAEGARTTTAMYLKTSQVKADGTKQEMELYYVGEYMYTNVGGTWQKLQVGAMPTDLIDAFDFNKVLKESQNKGELSLKPVGPVLVRGVACMKYEFVIKDPQSKGQGFASLGITDGLLYRLEGESTDANNVTSKIVFECWDYNKDFTIEPPIP